MLVASEAVQLINSNSVCAVSIDVVSCDADGGYKMIGALREVKVHHGKYSVKMAEMVIMLFCTGTPNEMFF